MKQCLLMAILLSAISGFAQQWQEVDASQVVITDSSGYYLFKSTGGEPLSGGYNIYWPDSRLKVQLKEGYIHGVYWEFDALDRPLLQYNFHEGVYHGRQVTYYKHKSKMRESQEYCYGIAHGEFARYDSSGNIVHSWYYLNGKEIDSKPEYLERSKTVTCMQPQQEELVGMLVPDDFWDQLLGYDLIDTIWVKDEVTLLQGNLQNPELIGCQLDQEVKLTVLASNEWNLESYVPLFKPADNEVVVYCGIVKAAGKRQIHFALGKNIRKAYLKNDCSPAGLLDHLEYTVFGAAGFPTILARYALEMAIKNEDPVTRQ